jgi:hypothetical protein
VSSQVSANDPEKKPGKKPYSEPQLKMYGGIADITLASATAGAKFDFRGDFLFDMRTQ